MHNQKLAPIITIDGPSGTGKGTISQMIAKHLHWNYLDSGSIYRVLGFAAIRNNISLQDTRSLVSLAHSLDLSFKIDGDFSRRVFLEELDISDLIRTESCGQHASVIAANQEVRAALLQRQRQFATEPGLVTDGRDMGTVVFPQAVVKIFLTASVEVRAHRRCLQLKKEINDANLAQVAKQLSERDARDSLRDCAPLVAANDAFAVDTTESSIAEVFAKVLKIINEVLATKGRLF